MSIERDNQRIPWWLVLIAVPIFVASIGIFPNIINRKIAPVYEPDRYINIFKLGEATRWGVLVDVLDDDLTSIMNLDKSLVSKDQYHYLKILGINVERNLDKKAINDLISENITKRIEKEYFLIGWQFATIQMKGMSLISQNNSDAITDKLIKQFEGNLEDFHLNILKVGITSLSGIGDKQISSLNAFDFDDLYDFESSIRSFESKLKVAIKNVYKSSS